MGKPFERLKYKPPEECRPDELVTKGEAISMIADFLALPDRRPKVRRRVKGKVDYAVRTGRLYVNKNGRLIFNDLAAWANQKYAERNPAISRMRHNGLVQIEGVTGKITVGGAKSFESSEEYTADLLNENAKLREELAEKDAQIERDRSFTETGKKVRAASRLGANTPKIMIRVGAEKK